VRFRQGQCLRPTTSKDTTRIARTPQHRNRERHTKHAWEGLAGMGVSSGHLLCHTWGTHRMHLSNIGTKCNSLTQQFIRISTTIDTWATCFDSIESSSGPQRLQIQLLQGGQVHCGIPNAYIIVS